MGIEYYGSLVKKTKAWFPIEGKEWIEQYLPSFAELINAQTDSQGVYGIFYKNIPLYVGNSVSSVKQRIKEHAFNLAHEPRRFFGIEKEELNYISAQKLSSNESDESSYIDSLQPILQCSNYRKWYRKGEEQKKDRCIYKRYRYQAVHENIK